MTSSPGIDDLTRPDTPLTPQPPPDQAAMPNVAADTPSVRPTSDSELMQLLNLNDILETGLLSASLSNKSQPSLPPSDQVLDDTTGLDLTSSEAASADISVARDGSFVETSSGPAARDIKRRWDQLLGVGQAVRSPYAITAFVNQHGKPMFRVGRREMLAPAASSAEVEERITQSTTSSEPSNSPHAKRRSRISMHAILGPSIFKNGSTSSGKSQTPFPQSSGPRKLRKTRSIPDLVSSSANDTSIYPLHHTSTTSVSTGRAHSHSVTGADVSPFSTVAVARPRDRDLFGEIMDWTLPSSSISTHSLSMSRQQISNEPHDHSKSPAVVMHPFGHGITFDSPSRKPAFDFLPAPRLLREMQSFESGLTARQPDLPSQPGQESSLTSEVDYSDDADRPPSALRLRTSSSSVRRIVPTSESAETPVSLKSEVNTFSRYSTEVFDVLQTYRGLPLLEKLSLGSEETTVIKMSLSADDTAAPRDDPRFVIWGEIQVERDHDDSSISHGSVAESSVNSSSMSKRRNIRAKEAASVQSSLDEPQKVIIAATIERWIAQLTSDLNYDELLDFFLTYRTYVSAVDLCHLFICRFHWALQHTTTPRDERVRRIVRVRTFVAIRYWLLTFFLVDFVPNRELRLLFGNWLNALIRDPVLEKHNDGRSIVKKLIKVAKDCRRLHGPHAATIPKPRTLSAPSKPQEHVLGAKFAEAIQKPNTEDDDSDVDLDFLQPQEGSSDVSSGFPNDPANAHLTTAHVGVGLSPARPASIPFSSFSILQRTEHAQGPITEIDGPFIQATTNLPIHHGVLSRAFVKTIGRLGRWKRVLNSRSATRTSLGGCGDVSAFDLELNIPRDLLTVNGGVEQYLGITSQTPVASAMAITDHSPPTSATKSSLDDSQSPLASTPPPETVEDSSSNHLESATEETLVLESSDESVLTPEIPENIDNQAPTEEQPDILESEGRALSLRSSSTDSFGAPLAHSGMPPTFPPPARPQWQFDVVSIDDLDFSDTSSDHHAVAPTSPPGLRRPPRRLPLRRDFEFVSRPETVSSMGLTSRDSTASNDSTSALSSPSIALGGNIAQWQMMALIDSLSNDEEPGDVEDALRRLEGQIHPQKQREKASKVDGWVRTIQERMAAGDYQHDMPQFSDDEDDADLYQSSEGSIDDSASQHSMNSWTAPASTSNDPSIEGDMLESNNTPIPTQTAHLIPPPPPGPESPTRPDKPAPEDAVPLEILQSRMPSRSSMTSSHKPSMSMFAAPDTSRIHRSFIMNHRASELAEHFAMIDRELFMCVKFEELVVDDWMNCAEVDILDWAQYLKDRARWKAEKRNFEKTSALAAVRARFNLMANFTISEIVLTQPHERPVLVAKFIRIAWKAYNMCSFNTLVAIIAALQSEWVTKAMRKSAWNRVGIWENRMFKDLKIFTTNADDFRYIRQVVESIVDAKPLDASSHSASVVSGGGTDAQSGKIKAASEWPTIPTACVPFIGVYLSQLQRHSKLPDLIDPTAPNEAVGVDPITSNFNAPAHPEVFSTLAPLPPSMHLEPLINVHKQRRIAGVIKALVAGQHLARRVHFEVDKRTFQKCLRLRGLSPDLLQRALAVHSD